MPARSEFVERWGQLLLLLLVWLLLSAVGVFAARLESVRHALQVRATGGIAIAAARAGEVVRVRGIPRPESGATQLTDDSGSVTLPGSFIADSGDPRLEAVGCTRLEPGPPAHMLLAACDRAPLLAAGPATLSALEHQLYRRALNELAIVLATLLLLGYLAGRWLGGPLGRRVRKARAVRL